MPSPAADLRSPHRRAMDDLIADELPLALPELPANAKPLPIENHLVRHSHPVAVAGVVENGLVRPLDPTVKLTERARVIIVSSESN